ncbi:Coenzyme F420-reducing hydrogenase, beta subunit [Pseudobutyrivibrio sp. 49]|uniref:polysaccharide pyruvyl transferase family protein n=1 Tax=Pseudobutyrivibrio sp. 49 TaxID=1855344 RepID=UPI0008874E8A|nr:polysaccharide pyruvyl transferase family protein [Pseudobutyrivibrio sp. 49]SDI34789.1 Coenzyme F420-reducing hydrogenase, beta subunit [Pseudobutyrivibrio sp. 49]
MDKSIINVKRIDCTGCGACKVACPVDAIKLEYDNDGFLYPVVTDACINCGKCAKACQVIHPVEKYPTPKAYAFMATQQIREVSSSGGLFSLLATYVIGQGGAVFGAVYGDGFKSVYMTKAETIDEIAPMRGSKYVFCETRDTYKEAKELLEAGRQVLYTGTPCEIAGLRTYLGKEYDNLLLVDFVCHAANSVKAYKAWLKEITEGKELKKLDFRDKNFYKWSTPAVAYFKDGTVKKQPYNECFWYNGFLEGVINRDNCAHCEYACAERVSDITMGDAWQVSRINKDYSDGIGTSLVLVNSEKGEEIFNKIQTELKNIITLCEEIPLEEIRKYNGNINFPQKQSPARKFFFSHLDSMGYHNALWYGRGRRWDFGLVGWWFASNYGSALTYFALAKVLEKMGKASIFIPIPKLDGTPWDDDTKNVEAFIGKHFRIAKKRDKEHMHEMNHFCDAFMLGSDQMWRESTTKLVGHTFFLDFVAQGKKKIACAPSFGAGKYSKDANLRMEASVLLDSFDAVSVRETSGVDICKEVFGVEAQQIIDPIFWVDTDVYDEIAEQSTVNDLPEKYLFCYVLDPNDEKVKIAERIAAERNLEVITILGMREAKYTRDKWTVGRIIDNASVEDFVNAIRKCEYMFTDSHHGVCLAIKYNKNYVAIGNVARGLDRFTTVGGLLGLNERIISLPNQGEDDVVALADIDYAPVNEKLSYEINRGITWMDEAIKRPVKPETPMYSMLRRIVSLEKEVAALKNR